MKATLTNSRIALCHNHVGTTRRLITKLTVVSQHLEGKTETVPVDRRRSLSLLLLPALLFATPSAHAFGKDPRKLLKEKDARKAKLREAAAKMKEKGMTENAFDDSKYSLPEEARTPNLRTLADERLRKE